MLGKLFLISTLICVTKCENSFYRNIEHNSVENIYAILDQTTEYFKNLNNAYEVLNTDTSNNISDVISQYMENTTKTVFQSSKRQKRSLESDLQLSKGANVLQDFEETLSFNLPDIQDIAFFSLQDEHQLSWYAVAVDSANILLYQLVNNKAQLVGTFPQSGGKRIIVNNYSTDTLVVVQKDTDGIVILRLSKNKNKDYELQFKQEFEISGVVHMNMWLGMNHLYLGIASETKIFIYVWLGEHFTKIDTLHFGARKLLPFQNKGFMHIVIVGSLTKIFRFSVRSNKFVETQKLHYAADVNSFYFKEGHFKERFLVLADNDSTIFYKEMYDRFVPFQKVAPTKYIHSLTIENTIVLFFAEKDTAAIYQYNGWRFLKLQMKLSNIRQIHLIRSHDGDVLVAQNQDGQWKFLKPVWSVKKTWKSLQNEIIAWCSEIKRKAPQRTLEKISDLKNPVISNAYIGQLRVQNINDHNAEELIRLTQLYKNTIAKLNLTKNILAQEKPKQTILHGKKVTIKCKANCYIHRIITDNEIKPAKRMNELVNQTLQFASMKVNTIHNWKCPIPNFNVDDIYVKKFINGISMQDLQNRTLKISGDQEISGKFKFTNLHATNVSIPLDIATNSTRQSLRIEEARVKELHLINDGFLLPLNGSVTEMKGSITAAKIRVTGLIDMKGGIKGEGRKILAPMKEIFTPLILSDDRFLQNVTFRNLVRAKDIVRPDGRSLKEISENIIPLHSNVPVHLMLSSNKTQWSNVTLWNYTNWVTKNSAKTVVITGAKFANNTVLTNDTYANIPIPKLTIPLCAAQVASTEIRTSSVTMGDLIVQNLNVSHIHGAYNLNTTIFDSVSALHNIDFSTKLFTGYISVKNISVPEINGMDLKDLKIRMNEWIDVNRLKGPINIAKLSVKNLETPAYLDLSLPVKVKNVVMKADSDIKKINGINIQSFMNKVLKVDDVISLEHVTFNQGFTSNHVYASSSTLNLSHLDASRNFNLHSKRISTTLKTDAISVPQTFGYIASDEPSTFIIQGSATFLTEPTVQNINDVNLKQLSEDLWMADQNIVVSASNMNIKNMTLAADVKIHNFKNSLNIRMWLDLSDKLLSKTKEQHITVISSFKNVEVPAIIAANDSIIQSSDFNLNDMLTNSLMRNGIQIVNAPWKFEELYINDTNWNGKLNNIDLKTDIVRHDTKQNIITGKKMVSGLIARDLWSLDMKFSNFVTSTVTQKCQKLFVIKGRKTFNNITLDNLSVKGTIMGRNVEEALLKSGDQTVVGFKKIQGQLNAPSLITNSTINDVNLTKLINNQMKKHKAKQVLESEFDFRNDLEIFGNIVIDGLYEGLNLMNITNQNKYSDAVLNRTTKVMELTEDITTALQHRAIYVSKFERVDDNALKIIFDTSTIEDVMDLNSTCLCEQQNISFCNDTKLLNIHAGTNSSVYIMKKLVLLDNVVFIIIVSSNFVSIHSYIAAEEQLDQKAGLYVPGILQASVEPIDSSLWIILCLSEQTLILRYQVWNELEQYILPGSDTFVISKTPNNQHLLIRSDGMWNLGGVSQPEHIFKIRLNGEINTFALGADYYVKATTENSTAVLKARYVGN